MMWLMTVNLCFSLVQGLTCHLGAAHDLCVHDMLHLKAWACSCWLECAAMHCLLGLSSSASQDHCTEAVHDCGSAVMC